MSLEILSVDKAPPKPKTTHIRELKALPSGDKKEENQQLQQAESTMPGSKLMDAITNSAVVDTSMARISFTKDDGTGEIVIRVIDNETDEVLMQIPPEAIVELRKRLGDLQGLLLDKKA
jgi:flagellar protein FlaG